MHAEPGDLFVETWLNGNYQLAAATAVARNTGTCAIAPAVDITGKSRPIGAGLRHRGLRVRHAALVGDYNHDNIVDAADYSVWRDTFGSTTNLAADGDGSGKVDAGDFTVWKNYFATGSGGGGALFAVPEPTAATLAIFAMAVFLAAWFVAAARRLC